MITRLVPRVLMSGCLASAAERPITERIQGRDYPSVFQAWNGATPVDGADAEGKFVIGWVEGGYRLLDVEQRDWQAQVARRAAGVMGTVLRGARLLTTQREGSR